MKILLVADHEDAELWGSGSKELKNKLMGVDLVLSAGDLNSNYLEYLADNIKAPLVFVPGNHDQGYKSTPPKRCINADEKIIEFSIMREGESINVRIFGVGGSMRYKDGPYLYSEEEQSRRVQKLMRTARKNARKKGYTKNAGLDILLTHAPCRGYGDMQDIPHRGFECFNDFLYELKPKIHCYGHIHEEYNSISPTTDGKGFQRVLKHPSGTTLINGSDYCFIEMK